MRVRVLFFGVLKELTGKSVDEVDLANGASLSDLLIHYRSQIPKLGELFSSIALAVNQQYAGPETVLKANDEVALLPPVSGGNGNPGEASDEQRARRRPYASITRERIDAPKILDSLKRGEDGACLVFDGIVRDHTRGRKTLYLDYESYEAMALSQMEALAVESMGKFHIRDVAIVHRLGRLEIGETSVLIAVVSAHRAAAFEACRWLIDTLKRTVPIWKKEYFSDGAVWADGEPFPQEIPKAEF